ncbi:caspase-related protein [Amycolatopsis mediterranei S699]|uniref:Caspase-related protein n=2 Tax=Amycolatopsis mediterranei TaxID=33910 RepID=A0A0H3CYY0_AMYMU|nr:caspase-related protein [Amycolatopsis mediterranei U32]AEK40274.1 caspase-related protein [Amycolatopsis mediterranei S699]AFO75280.1 caspase-related protein [Amycolatopsis mediterranei S699]AGT82409.1 caspase-related protein [Amycolatopsis mediterranei RB]
MIVANGEYDNAGLQRLGSPAADADALAGVLADRAISDFDVSVVRNETAHVVQAEIEDLCAEGGPDDVLLLHFSCHGLKDDSGGLYFAARNTRPDRLRSTAVPAQFVQQCIRQSRSRSIVLLLDCCYGGAFGQGVAVRASGDANVLDSFRGGRGRAVITASNSIEYAFEGARLASDEPARPSVFTSALVEGLRTGEADRDEDGWIALGELYEYLFDRVRERNPKQTPSRDIEMQGELYLAKSRRRRIKPSPIPPDLAAAIGAENPFTRLGAVAELRRRLSSSNLPVAMGAFEALKTMSSTDIEHVAAAASDALSFAVVRVDTPSVRLSAAADSRASGSLRVLGPPVAREVRFEASHSWIVVTEVAGGAELSVTAGDAGVRRGKVVVSGPTGEVVVAVEIEALPVAEPEAVVAEAEPEPAAPEPVAPEPAASEAVVSEPAVSEPAVSEAVAEPVASKLAASEAVVAEPATSEPATSELAAPESATAPEPAVGAVPEPAAAAPGSVVAEQTRRLATDSEPEPVVAAEAQPAAAAPVPVARPATEPAGAMDPVGGFAGVVAIAGAVFAVAGLPLKYRYGYSLTQYRPGMESAVLIVAACALLAGILTLTPRTRSWTGPALLFGTGLAALFGLLRFLGEAIALSQNGDTELKTGYTFALLAHIAWLVAGASALAALRRSPAVALGAGRVRGWPAWVAIGLGVAAATGWIVQLVDLNTYDSSDAGRATAYFLLGALLAVIVPVVAMTLRPSPVGCAVLATGTAGLLGVLAPTFAAVAEESSLALGGQLIAVVALVLLAADTAVLAVRARNQPNGRQS